MSESPPGKSGGGGGGTGVRMGVLRANQAKC